MSHTFIRMLAIFGVILLGPAMAACSSTKSDDKKVAAKEPPGADKDYPKLGTVPAAPLRGMSAEQRMEIERGLYADRRSARHVDGPVAGEVPEVAARPVPDTPVRPQIVTPGSGPVPVARPQPPRPDLALKVGANGFVTTIQFGVGETSLPTGTGGTVVNMARLLAWSGGTMVLNGHSASGDGDADTRRQRSMARAQAVANGLMNLGVPADRIRTVAHGDSRPRVRDDAERDGENARVEVFILGAQRR